MVKYGIAILSSLLLAICAQGMETRSGIFNPDVQTLTLKVDGAPESLPFLTLGGDEQLMIEFDHLSEDREFLRYDLVHCDADWQPSQLVESEYLDGFNIGDIDEYDFSQLAMVHYVHYWLPFPNPDMVPKVSGNYLLRIFPEQNPDDIWLQCRILVSEQTAKVQGGVSSRTDVDYNKQHQQLELAVNTERSKVQDPFNDLKVYVQQNAREDNQAFLPHPLRMSDWNTAVYEHQEPLIFRGGNEYRRFETVSVYYPSMGVQEVVYNDPMYNFVLAADQPRNENMYLYDQTQHGRFLIREYNSSQSEIEADYALVHFSLEMPEIPGAVVCLDGDFVRQRLDSRPIMLYNSVAGRYERVLMLKQGAYNYQYLVFRPGQKVGDTSAIEGDNYQTTNEYLVKVYARNPGERYDRLIAVKLIYSAQ